MDKNKTAEYFSHDCNANQDPKIMLMIAQLGLEAYGIYWILIEYLRQQPGYAAPIILLDPLSRRYGSSKEKFEAIVTKFMLFEFNDTVFFSPSLMKRMEPLDMKRERMQQLALMRWNKDDNAGAMRTQCAGNAQAMQSKVKESRVKNSKVNKSKEEEELSISPSFVADDFWPAWKKWLDYKRLIKSSYKNIQSTQEAYEKLLRLSDNNADTAMKIVKQSIAGEWKGLFALKDENIKTAGSASAFAPKISTKYLDR